MKKLIKDFFLMYSLKNKIRKSKEELEKLEKEKKDFFEKHNVIIVDDSIVATDDSENDEPNINKEFTEEEKTLKWDNVCFGRTYENNFGLAPNLIMNKNLITEDRIGYKFRPTFPNLILFGDVEINDKPLPKYYIIFNCWNMMRTSDEDYTYMELLVLSDDLDFERAFEEIKKSMTEDFWLKNSEKAYY